MKTSTISFTNEALSGYKREGYFVQNNVFSNAECNELIKAGMELSNVDKKDFRPRIQPHRENTIFLDALKNPNLTAIMSKLIKAPIVGLQTQFFYGVPGVKGFASHQDNYFVEAPDHSFASAWIALVDVDSDMGCLYGFPGSHKEGRLSIRKIASSNIGNQDPNANNEEAIVPEIYKRVLIPALKGSVVFLHSQFVHGSETNISPNYRYSLLCTYLSKGASFRAGQYAKRECIELS
jgi:ectoine hydroxylase-related dioxygenase (phytanoyl-CoA dioxygenase family)